MSVRAAALCIVAALGGAAVPATAAAAAHRRPAPYSLELFPGPPGSTAQFLAVGASGAAVGYRRMPDGSRHGLFFSGKQLVDASPVLGPASEIRALNDRHDLVGWRATNPKAATADLFPTKINADAAPHAFFLSRSGGLQLVPVPSFANAVNLSDIVVGDFRAPDGQMHAFALDEYGASTSPPAHRTKLELIEPPPPPPAPVFVDLGIGEANGIDGSDDIVGSHNGQAGYWIKTGKDQWLFRPAGFVGTLLAINDRGIAIGSKLDPLTNTTLPVIAYGLGKRVARVGFDHIAPSVDVAFTGLSNGPVVSAIEFGPGGETISLIGDLSNVDHPLKLLDAQPTLHLHFIKLEGLGAVNTNGLLAGSAQQGGVLGAVLLVPRVVDKLDRLIYTLRRERSHQAQVARMSAAIVLITRGRTRQACDVLTRVRRHFDLDHYYATSDLDRADSSDDYWSVREAQEELGCPNIGPPVVDPPIDSQETITTIVGNYQVM